MTPIVGEPHPGTTKRARTPWRSLQSATARGAGYCASELNDENHLAGVMHRPRSAAAVSRRARRDTGHARGRMIIMRIPQQVPERVKEAPAQALRAVFSGIGQVLLVADRIKTRATEPGRAQPTATDGPGQNAAAAPKDEARWRSLDETGNVRLLPEDEAPAPAEPAAAKPAADTEPAAAVEPAAVTEPAAVPEPAAVTEPAAVPEPAAGPEPAVARAVGRAAPAALPVPHSHDP